MSAGRPITEEDLHAYVDAALDPSRRAEVEAYLKHHADVAQRVQGYMQQREALRAIFGPIAEEPIPSKLNLTSLVEAGRRPSRNMPWRAAAAAVLLFSLGGVGGWTFRGASSYIEPSGIAALAQEATFNYTVYSPDHMHPVEFKAANSAELIRWISNRLQTPIMVPDLSASGYRFMGGRLVATVHGPAGLLMYDNDHGIRLVMFVRPMERDMNTHRMSQSVNGPVTGFSWAHNGIGYSVVGAASPDILHPLANEIRRQLTTGI
jgi:anti-sigma factor RsiW